jgi:hypothetical protein
MSSSLRTISHKIDSVPGAHINFFSLEETIDKICSFLASKDVKYLCALASAST